MRFNWKSPVFPFKYSQFSQFIEFKEAPEFKTFFLKDIDSINKSDINFNNIKLIFEKEISTIEANNIVEKIQSYKPNLLQTEFRVVINDIESEIQINTLGLKSNKEILNDYINLYSHPEHLKINLIKV